MHLSKLASAAALASSLVLAGCSDPAPGPTTTGSRASSPAYAEHSFNDADVWFAQQMIPHHQQAVVMSAHAADRAGSQDVKDLAATIEAAQGPELETMSRWLRAWGADVPGGATDSEGMAHGNMAMEDTPGMMSAQDMANLMGSTGSGFDRMFLTMMIAHHEGAIEMARIEQADGQNTDAVALARKIEADQTAEITTMQELLAR